MADPRLRQLKIKSGVVKRLGKERTFNCKEVTAQEARVEKYRADASRDEYDVKKQLEVLEEAKMMIPDTQRRLESAHGELTALLAECGDAGLGDAPEFTAAKEIVDAVPLADLN